MYKAILVDLDQTLIDDKQATASALYCVAEHVETRLNSRSSGVSDFTRDVRSAADSLFKKYCRKEYCDEIGISAIEALWYDYDSNGCRDKEFGNWARGFQYSVWLDALMNLGFHNSELAMECAVMFREIRRRMQFCYPDVDDFLERMAGRVKLALVTNGASGLQRQKLEDTGYAGRFDALVVSSEIGFGKPNQQIFEQALKMLNVEASSAAMIGDNYRKDIIGALEAGVAPYWINRDHEAIVDMDRRVTVLRTLTDFKPYLYDQGVAIF